MPFPSAQAAAGAAGATVREREEGAAPAALAQEGLEHPSRALLLLEPISSPREGCERQVHECCSRTGSWRNHGKNEAFGFCGQLLWGGERQRVFTAPFICVIVINELVGPWSLG